MMVLAGVDWASRHVTNADSSIAETGKAGRIVENTKHHCYCKRLHLQHATLISLMTKALNRNIRPWLLSRMWFRSFEEASTSQANSAPYDVAVDDD